MGTVDIVVVLASAVLVAVLGRYFFGPRRAGAARLEGGVQRVEVTVRGGCSPDVIKVRQGTPAELVFDRQEAGECTSRVVFPDLEVGAGLPAHTRTTVRLSPDRPGSFGFACGMNMIRGTLLVEPADGPVPPAGDGSGTKVAPPPAPAASTGGPPSGEERTAAEAEAADAAERQGVQATVDGRAVLVGTARAGSKARYAASPAWSPATATASTSLPRSQPPAAPSKKSHGNLGEDLGRGLPEARHRNRRERGWVSISRLHVREPRARG